MPALNYKARFAPLVRSGRKRQTIRALRKDGRDPKPGDTLYHYTGMRTKACRKLSEAVCQSAVPIHMTGGMMAMESVEVDGKWLVHHELDWLAQADGFRDWEEMRHWFFKTHGAPFTGLLIRW